MSAAMVMKCRKKERKKKKGNRMCLLVLNESRPVYITMDETARGKMSTRVGTEAIQVKERG